MLASTTPIIKYDGPEINYAQDRNKVLHSDLKIPAGQNVAAVSFLEGDPRALHVHGCFVDTEAAKKHIEQLVELHKQAEMPFPKHTAIFENGVWRSWPPTRENTEKFSLQDKNVDPVLHSYFANQTKMRKDVYERALNSAGTTQTDEKILCDALEHL